jgi:hypothetical protein
MVISTALAESSKVDGHVFCNGIRLQDEIVVINTRRICGRTNDESIRNGLAIDTYAIHNDAGQRRWMRTDLDSFLAFDPAVPTVIFVHGNQITEGDAKHEGLAIYRRMIDHGADAERIRFVIFSWPSSKVGRLLQDVRIKAGRTGPAGHQLAWLLDQMPAETPVSLVGFSFGARIITGALHIVAGGRLNGSLALHERNNPERAPVQAVLIAPALHAHWLGKGQFHGLAMTQVSEMLMLNNCQDRAMKFYHFLTPGRGGPQALGLRGATRLSADYAAKIHYRDVSGYVGSQHDLFRYLCVPGAAGQIWDYTAAAEEEPAKITQLSMSDR